MTIILKETDNFLKYGKPPAILKTHLITKGLVIVATYIRQEKETKDTNIYGYEFTGYTRVKKEINNKWLVTTNCKLVKRFDNMYFKTRKQAFCEISSCVSCVC
jgi:hypothetical protein